VLHITSLVPPPSLEMATLAYKKGKGNGTEKPPGDLCDLPAAQGLSFPMV